MVLETLTRSQKLGLLGLLVGIGVAAVVIPLVAVGGGGVDDLTGKNLTQAEVLKQIRKELRDMAEQLRIHLNTSISTTPSSPLDKGVEESAAKVSVESRRKKRQAPPPPQAPIPAASPTLPPGAPIALPNGSVVPTNTNASIASTAATLPQSTTISPLLLLVDETSNVLEMLEKTDKQIFEAAKAANSTEGTCTPGEEAQLVGKIAQLRDKVGRIELHSPADKQLASDLLTRVLNAEQDVTRTLEAVQVKEVEVAAKRKAQALASLTRLNTTLAQLLNNLSLKLNSPIKVEQQLPANTPVVATPVANTPLANTPVANAPVANTPVANTPVANTPVATSSEANKTGSATNNSASTIGDQNSPPTFNTLQKEIGEELDAGRKTLAKLADSPAQLSVQTQTTLNSIESILGRLTGALAKLTVKDEEERGAGRLLLTSLEETKKETTRALASLANDNQQATSATNPVVLPANNNTLVSVATPSQNGAPAVDTKSAAASSSSLSEAAPPLVNQPPALPPPPPPAQ